MIPYLPFELWEIIFRHGSLRFSPFLRMCPKQLASKKLQIATRAAAKRRVPRDIWKEGLHVRVYRQRTKRWLIGQFARITFNNNPTENWAVVVFFRTMEPRLLIFLDHTNHPPLRRVEDIEERIFMSMPGQFAITDALVNS